MNIHLRIAWWAVWSNFITILASIQAIIATLMLNAEIFDHHTFRLMVIANAVLTAIVAQVKRNNPPGDKPTREEREPDADHSLS